MDEEKLVRDLRKGDTDALRELIENCHTFVSSIIGRILRGRKSECEELTQDVFLTAWENRRKLEAGKIRPYLAVIARNKAFGFLRKYHEDLPLDEDILIFDDENIELRIERKELSEVLEEALNALPKEHRELFVRHYYYGQTVSEAAEAMGINESTAKSRLKRGREKLREILLQKGVQPESAVNAPRLARQKNC